MDRNLWLRLYTAVTTTAYDRPARRVRHPDWVIAVVYLWAAGHHRPTAWACQAGHWEPWAHPPRLPSPPALSRRAG